MTLEGDFVVEEVEVVAGLDLEVVISGKKARGVMSMFTIMSLSKYKKCSKEGNIVGR